MSADREIMILGLLVCNTHVENLLTLKLFLQQIVVEITAKLSLQPLIVPKRKLSLFGVVEM